MGLSSTTNRVSYAGDGSSTIFSFPYYFFAQSDLQVYLYDTVASAVQPQTLNTHYTVSGSVNLQGVYPGGGNVVMNSSVPTGLQIVVARAPSPQQNYTLLQNGQINAVALVQQFDYLTALVQRLQDEATRSIALPDGLGSIGGNSFSQTLPQTILLGSSANAPLVLNSGATGWAFGTVASNQSGATAYFGTLPVPNGGTGAQSFTAHGLLLGQGSGVVTALTGGAAGTFLQSNGPSSDPAWGTPSISGSSVTGILAPQFGGTGASGLAIHGVLVGEGSSAISALVSQSSGQILQSFGPSADPQWVNILPIANGGTGAGSSLVNSRMIQSLGGTFAESALVINGSNAVSHGVGSLQNPGVNFLAATNNGLFYTASSTGQAYVAMVCSSIDAVNSFAVTGTIANVGIGLPAASTTSVPLQCNRTLNATVFYAFGNASAGALSGTVFQIQNGASSNYTTIENWANLIGTSYLAGASAVFGNNNQTALLLGSEFASGFIGFTVGGRALVNEKARLNLTNFTLNKGVNLILTGSNGTVTMQVASSVVTHSYVLPAAQGAANTFLQQDSGGTGVLQWASPSGASKAVSTKTANYNATAADDIVVAASGCSVVNLYGVSGNSGKVLWVKNTSVGTVTIVGSSATIDGTSVVLPLQYAATEVFCDGSNWFTFRPVPKQVNRITLSSTGTYTMSSGCTSLWIRQIAGGGGGAGGGTSGNGTAGNGGNTIFGSSTILALVCAGGSGGTANGTSGGAGGSAALIGSSVLGFSFTGSQGGSIDSGSALANLGGGPGGSGPFGGAGASNTGGGAGGSAVAGTGSGASGAGDGGTASAVPGPGGGSGAYIDAIVINPSAYANSSVSFVYQVGDGGVAGIAGTSGNQGGTGAKGTILIEERFI